jgi:tRNA-dihydrouridine synthase
MKNFWEKLPKPFLCLAPMEGVTDAPFRQIMLTAGKPDVMFTEFTSVDGLFSLGWDHVKQRLEYVDTERPLVAQIWGLVPENFFNAARLLSSLGFDGVDINFGCPVKDVIKMGACSAMINNKPLAAELIAATKEGLAGQIPLSVKIRIGFAMPETEEWVGFLLEQDIQALTVHGRTTKELSKVPADWGEIAKAVKVRDQMKAQTIIIGNGDVNSREEALAKSQESGVDGVMIGRGVFHDPYLFKNRNPSVATSFTSSLHTRVHDSNESLTQRHGKLDLPSVSSLSNTEVTDRLGLLLKHMHLYEAYWAGTKPFANLKKYFKIYCQGFDNAKDLRVQLMEAGNSSQVQRIINTWLKQSKE